MTELKIKVFEDKSLKNMGGRFKMVVHRVDGTEESSEGPNIITDLGIATLGDILVGVETTDLDLAFMELGEGTTTPVVGDTDVEDPLEGSPHPARLAVTSQIRNASTPFDVVIEAFLSSTDYTRPQTVSELTVWFNDNTGTKLFARGLLASALVINANDTATLSYGFVFR